MSLISSFLSTAITVMAVAFGFGCAAGIAALWLHGVVAAITRYNVSDCRIISSRASQR